MFTNDKSLKDTLLNIYEELSPYLLNLLVCKRRADILRLLDESIMYWYKAECRGQTAYLYV